MATVAGEAGGVCEIMGVDVTSLHQGGLVLFVGGHWRASLKELLTTRLVFYFRKRTH